MSQHAPSPVPPGRQSAVPGQTPDHFDGLPEADRVALWNDVFDAVGAAILKHAPTFTIEQIDANDDLAELRGRAAGNVVEWLIGGKARLVQRFWSEFEPLYPHGPDPSRSRKAASADALPLWLAACREEPEFHYVSMADQIIANVKERKRLEWRQENGRFVTGVVKFFEERLYRAFPAGAQHPSRPARAPVVERALVGIAKPPPPKLTDAERLALRRSDLWAEINHPQYSWLATGDMKRRHQQELADLDERLKEILDERLKEIERKSHANSQGSAA